MSRRRGPFGQLLFETSYVARVYGESLRDNFVGFAPADAQAFAALSKRFEDQMGGDRPDLSVLFQIEAELVGQSPDDVVVSRFWSLDDRFRRVVPVAVAARYDASVPPRADAIWTTGPFVRRQTRTLMDVIHSNYLVNIGREESVKRLKAIIFAAGATLLAIGLAIGLGTGSPLLQGLLLLAGAGTVGSFLSIMNRLQRAVAKDAMEEDGVFELIGLRTGWVGIIASLLLGGMFALVLYLVVAAGMLDVATPRVALVDVRSDAGGTAAGARAPSRAPGGRPAPASTATVAASGSIAGSPPIGGIPGPAAAPTSSPSTPAVAAPAVAGTAPSPRTAASPAVPPVAELVVLPDAPLATGIAPALGLADRRSLFKMLVLALLAGFAERLVPDILNRLGKQGEGG